MEILSRFALTPIYGVPDGVSLAVPFVCHTVPPGRAIVSMLIWKSIGSGPERVQRHWISRRVWVVGILNESQTNFSALLPPLL